MSRGGFMGLIQHFGTVQNYEHSARRRPINQLESVRLFWNYDPAGLWQQPRDEIDMDQDDAELADVQDLID
jgi:hypothetical protein